MPIISTFFGIVIRMYYKEHEPAHFHAEHSGEQATFDFDGAVIAGEISLRSGASASGHSCIGSISRRIGRKWKLGSSSRALPRCPKGSHEIPAEGHSG